MAKRYLVIACEILFRELSFCAAQSEVMVDFHFMDKALHDVGQVKMQQGLQAAIDEVDTEKYDAILLCYGLCNNGPCGLTASLPMVIPRAHDCITLLMGSKETYRSYFDANPGTFFQSAGWAERGDSSGGRGVGQQFHKTVQNYIDEYGEENGEYLFEMCESWVENYSRITYIDVGLGPVQRYKELTLESARENGWLYEEIPGSLTLLERLLAGAWNEEDFLVIPPGQSLRASYRENVVEVCENAPTA